MKAKVIYLLVFSFLISYFISYSFAVDTAQIYSYFSTPPGSSSSKTPDTIVKEMSGTFYKTLQSIGYALSVCVIAVTAIKLMISNPQQRALIKSKLWLIAIGIIILSSGTHLLNIIIDAINKMKTI